MSFVKLTCTHCDHVREIYKSIGIPDCPICGTSVTGVKPYSIDNESFCHTATNTSGCVKCGKYSDRVLIKPIKHLLAPLKTLKFNSGQNYD